MPEEISTLFSNALSTTRPFLSFELRSNKRDKKDITAQTLICYFKTSRKARFFSVRNTPNIEIRKCKLKFYSSLREQKLLILEFSRVESFPTPLAVRGGGLFFVGEKFELRLCSGKYEYFRVSYLATYPPTYTIWYRYLSVTYSYS